MSELEQHPEREEVPKEIERKFLINGNGLDLDSLAPDAPVVQITQYYLEINSDGSEVRIRKTEPLGDPDAASYVLTEKSGGDISRDERNQTITRQDFTSLLANGYVGAEIRKRRTAIPYQGVIIELDVYEGPLLGLVVAEVEFSGNDEPATLLAATTFTPPEWFGDDITAHKYYKNKYLALYGIPT